MKFSILAAVYFAAHLVGHSWASPAALEMLGDSDELEGDSKLCYLDMELNQKICNPDIIPDIDSEVSAPWQPNLPEPDSETAPDSRLNDMLAEDLSRTLLVNAKQQQEERQEEQRQEVCIIQESSGERECHSIDVSGDLRMQERAMIEQFSGCVIIEYHLGYIVLEFRACTGPQPCLDVEVVCSPERQATQLGAPQFIFLGGVDNFHSVQLFGTTVGYCLSGNPPLPKCADILLPPPLAVSHGNTIALQPHYDKRNWLGCSKFFCHKWGCPGLFMDGDDWTRCWGEVFEIYRREGPGPILVGDMVGIHYPRQPGRWFSCDRFKCGKAACPGIPSDAHGFSTDEKWSTCTGEVYKIYARGKPIGGIVESHDLITIYDLNKQDWIGLVGLRPSHRTCPGEVLPPPSYKYDQCWGEVFELVKRL